MAAVAFRDGGVWWQGQFYRRRLRVDGALGELRPDFLQELALDSMPKIKATRTLRTELMRELSHMLPWPMVSTDISMKRGELAFEMVQHCTLANFPSVVTALHRARETGVLMPPWLWDLFDTDVAAALVEGGFEMMCI